MWGGGSRRPLSQPISGGVFCTYAWIESGLSFWTHLDQRTVVGEYKRQESGYLLGAKSTL